MAEDAAAAFVIASSRREDGMAVARAISMDALWCVSFVHG